MNRKIDILLFPMIGLFLGLSITAIILSNHLLRNIDPSNNLEHYYIMTQQILESNNRLKEKIKNLEREHDKLTKLTVSPEDRKQLDTLKEELALNEINGKGIALTLIPINPDNFGDSNICYASYLRDIHNILTIPEAEVTGISINDNRINYHSTISCMGSGIAMDFQKIIPPIEIKIIGNPGKITNILKTKKFLPILWNDIENGLLNIDIKEVQDIHLESYAGNIKSNYIKNYVDKTQR